MKSAEYRILRKGVQKNAKYRKKYRTVETVDCRLG